MVMRKRLPCVVALLSHMASVNIVDNDGNTPLHLAIEAETPAIVQMLIGFGADIDARIVDVPVEGDLLVAVIFHVNADDRLVRVVRFMFSRSSV